MRVSIIVFRKKRLRTTLMVLAALLLVTGALFKSLNGPAAAATAPVYQGSRQDKKIALTFNVVWGEEYIPKIVECLKENNVPATFFIGGQWADDFPDLAGEIARAGNEVGSHGYSHPHPDEISRQENIDEITKTEATLVKVTGQKPTLFAPPYGERGDAVLEAAEETGYTTILWSIDTIDWQRPEPDVIVRRVTEKMHSGAIVLMHPTAPTVDALPQLISELKKEGYELVKVSPLLEGLKKDEAGTKGKMEVK